MIRLILTVLFIVIFLILSIPVFLVEWLLGKWKPQLKDRSSLTIVSWAFRVVMLCSGVKTTYIGDENIPTDEAVLFVANHRSFFDIVVNYAHFGKLKKLTGFISKKEVDKVPLFNIWMRNLHCVFLDRSSIREGMKMILSAIELVKSGISIFIFPEGTRSKEADAFLPFHEGSLKIAQKTGCAIIPVTINNSNAVLEDHFPFIKKTHVIVEYGKPVYVKDLPSEYQKQVGAYTQKLISETYFKNKELV